MIEWVEEDWFDSPRAESELCNPGWPESPSILFHVAVMSQRSAGPAVFRMNNEWRIEEPRGFASLGREPMGIVATAAISCIYEKKR